MLGRYQIKRGARLTEQPVRVQRGVRIDTRKHTRHCLRPTAPLVEEFFAALRLARSAAWAAFERAYRELLAQRFAEDRLAFDELCELAQSREVFIGCSCPTAKNPDVNHCHTVLALRFMKRTYPDLEVELP